MGLASTEFGKINFKTGSHDTIHIFKNYFATVFSVFNNKRYPNKHLVYVCIAFLSMRLHFLLGLVHY